MSISYEHWQLVHVPKTGGTSILTALGRTGTLKTTHWDHIPGGPTNAVQNHKPAYVLRREYPDTWSRVFSFAVTRHPFDRIVSAYGTLNTRADSDFIAHFERWILEGKPEESAFRPMSWWICDPGTLEPIVTRIYRFEDGLRDAFEDIKSHIDVAPNDLPHANANPRSRGMREAFRHCNPLVIDRLRKWYARDCDLFGYEWEDQ